MLEIIMGLVVAIVGLFLNGCRLSRKADKLGEEKAGLQKEADISLDMEVANKLAEENEKVELEQVDTDNWRNKI
jgi:hypothetical protein